MSEKVTQTFQEPLKWWLDPKTYYQILVVTPPDPNTKKEGQNIQTKIVAKTKEAFDTYLTDKNNLDGFKETVGSHLPSPGVTLEDDFLTTIFSSQSDDGKSIVVKPNQLDANNFYASSRGLLQSRKLSQLIANTWYCYVTAKKSEAWKRFINGNWDTIDSKILNGLIAREIFFVAQTVYPSDLEPDNIEIYYPLKGRTAITQNGGVETRKPRFLILPNSKAWERIALSLLIAGQAYCQIGEGNSPTDYTYQRISEPIFSTGEIVSRYGLEVVWSDYIGKISEVQFSPVDVSTNYQVVIPYPPIPDEKNLSLEEIEKWAEASDKEAPFPFYRITEDNRYVGIDYVSPPYPYIPLSSS
ncbi:hypothetical protein [Cylindrospermum sp. FACHB-282]|uniref:hypothetical protein n=1 Tax=Cylindrospermum sp. FACHB-282 TaxID=2692794 RepID=UPI00168A36AF|nr:hypothetical protein [Cylindrospermum sp. FACHB-282]MBD2386444.1 hypothetical protein [Cylindrospermum sp. FACHB-282]